MKRLPKRSQSVDLCALDADLRESLRLVGPLLPAWRVAGQPKPFDGRRRLRLCPEVGKSIDVVTLTPRRARHLLWTLHPERALELWGDGRSLAELAQHFGTREPLVARVLQQSRPRERKPKRGAHTRYQIRHTKVRRYVTRCMQGLEAFSLESLDALTKQEPGNT